MDSDLCTEAVLGDIDLLLFALVRPVLASFRVVVEDVEEDITRCICGHAEYPGPSASIKEQYGSTSIPPQEPSVISSTLLTFPAAVSDDIGNFFVQCDNCHVWQHGGCMGLNDESIIPDEYYCEKCRPDFHRVIKGSNVYVSDPVHPLTLVTLPRVLVAKCKLDVSVVLTSS